MKSVGIFLFGIEGNGVADEKAQQVAQASNCAAIHKRHLVDTGRCSRLLQALHPVMFPLPTRRAMHLSQILINSSRGYPLLFDHRSRETVAPVA